MKGKYIYVSTQLALLVLILWAMVCGKSQIIGISQFLPAALTSAATLLIWKEYRSEEKDSKRKPGQGRAEEAERRRMAAGLLLILVGDFFLCLLEGFGIYRLDWAGYLAFSCVQLCFALRIGRERPVWIIRLIVWLVMEGAAGMPGMMSPANFLAILNLALLLSNVIFAWRRFAAGREKAMLSMAVGLTFFAGCDYGLLAFALEESGLLRKVTGLFVWLCYVPAQIGLTLSFEAMAEGDNKIETEKRYGK